MTSSASSCLPSRSRVVRVVARHELRVALRGRLIPTFAAILAVLALGISLTGLSASGQLLVQGFTRTSVSLLNLGVYLLPLFGLLIGAAAFGGDDANVEMLLAEPVSRGDALAGRLLGLAGGMLLVSLVGYGGAGVLIAVATAGAGLDSYLLVALCTTLVGIVGLMAGSLIGVWTRGRNSALGWALAAWLVASILYDLASIAILQFFGSGRPGPLLVALLTFNPVDGMRALALQQLGSDVLLGPTGTALRNAFGAYGTLWIVGSATVWLAATLFAARTVFMRRDF